MENIKKDLATSLTSLIFVVISFISFATVLLNSPSGDFHPNFENSKPIMNNSIDKPLIVLGNNIAIIKDTKIDKKNFG